jgi:hypothetical protein
LTLSGVKPMSGKVSLMMADHGRPRTISASTSPRRDQTVRLLMDSLDGDRGQASNVGEAVLRFGVEVQKREHFSLTIPARRPLLSRRTARLIEVP